MTNVGSLKECPNCSEQVFKDKQKYCGGCGFNLNYKKEQNNFGTPDYFYYQVRELARRGVKPNTDNSIKITKLEEARLQLELHLAYIPGEDCIASASDTLEILQTLPHRKHTTDEIRSLVLFGKKIGNIAKAIEELYKSIGVFNAEQQGTSEFSE